MVAEWVAARIPHVGTVQALGPHVAVGVANDNGLIAGCIYHNYIAAYQTCEISFAASTPKFATREVIRGLLSIPFEQLGCRTVTLLVPHTSKRVHRFVSGIGANGPGIGFKRRGCVPEFFAPGLHCEVFSMTRHNYSQLRERIG